MSKQAITGVASQQAGKVQNEGSRPSMMDLWRAQIDRSRNSTETPLDVARQREQTRSEEAEKIRNREIPCPTCAARQYKDESNDHGVSFQSSKHIPSTVAGVVVMSHEMEHVAAKQEKAGEQPDGKVHNSTVALEYDTCPDCGRRIVAGGVTKTTEAPDFSQKKDGGEQSGPGGLNIRI